MCVQSCSEAEEDVGHPLQPLCLFLWGRVFFKKLGLQASIGIEARCIQRSILCILVTSSGSAGFSLFLRCLGLNSCTYDAKQAFFTPEAISKFLIQIQPFHWRATRKPASRWTVVLHNGDFVFSFNWRAIWGDSLNSQGINPFSTNSSPKKVKND